jgi:alcohol dehydrogenase/L-iditol 2-dehydrogenase
MLLRPGEMVTGDIPEPEPGPDDVRIAVRGVGLCGSDLSVFSGKWTAPEYPWVQGHEAFGTVDAVGERVPQGRLGELVVIEPNVACLRCAQCTRGWTSACVRRQSVGMNRAGALAEKLVVPSEYAWAINGPVSTDLACVEPLAVIEAALRRLADPLPEAALVVGVGSQGLLACLELIGRGVRVHAYDLNPERLGLATELGAVGLPADPAATPVELVVDTVGTPGSIEVALRHVGVGGTVVVIGLAAEPFEVTAQMLVRRQITLRGSLTYDHPSDFRATVTRVMDGHISPGRIITDEYPLEDAQAAFEQSGSARGKTWIRVAPEPPAPG